jgi:hypothetical protein
MDTVPHKLNKYITKYQNTKDVNKKALYQQRIQHYEFLMDELTQVKNNQSDESDVSDGFDKIEVSEHSDNAGNAGNVDNVDNAGNSEQIGGKGENKKCDIDDEDNLVLGQGGSNAFIIITQTGDVYKLFPLIYRKGATDKNIKDRKSREKRSYENEIKVNKELTQKIIEPGISSHFVKWIDDYVCDNVQRLFDQCPKSYLEYLQTDKRQWSKKDARCEKKFRRKNTALDDKFHVLQMEYCDYPSFIFIQDVSMMPFHEMEKCLDIFFFQIAYTLVQTQKMFPYFLHGDLFLRNILGIREKDNGNHYTYEYGGTTFYVPQKLFLPKIGDFGYTSLDAETQENIYEDKPIKSPVRDWYNIVYDVYDGGNLGASSLMSLASQQSNKDNKDNNNNNKDINPEVDDKKAFIRSYFSAFFNVQKVDDLKNKSPGNMNWDWPIAGDAEFATHIELKTPEELLNGYFKNIFGKINSNVGTFGGNVEPLSITESADPVTTTTMTDSE